MRIAIASDIHGNLEALQATLEDIAAQGADRIMCLGDIVGYNANPAECVALVRAVDAICVAGNHDRAVCGAIASEGFSATAARAVSWTRERLDKEALEFLAGLPLTRYDTHLVAVHDGLHANIGGESVRLETDEARGLTFKALRAHPSAAPICAFGHTHRLGIFELRDGVARSYVDDEFFLRHGAYYLLNPGTVGQPRTADRRASYLVLDTVRRSVTVRRVAYDASVALAKTRRAGLSPPFSWLPGPIRQALKGGVRALGFNKVAIAISAAIEPARTSLHRRGHGEA